MFSTLLRFLPVTALVLAACTAEPTSLSRPNLVVILVDTLRADHLGFHGYERDTTPFLDSIAREGVVYEQATAVSSYTRESVSALFTGSLPSMSGSLGWYATPADHISTLASHYAQAGYRTGCFTTTLMLGDSAYARGFDTVEHLVTKGGVSGMGPQLTHAALDFAKGADGQPFMMYVHYFDPHAPYEPPSDLKTRFTDSPHPDPVGLYTELRPNVPQYVAKGFGPGDALFEDQQQRYDAEISATDRALASLFAGLEDMGAADNTLVVITSDHGEEFLEHRFVEHAWTLYQESVHVPLIFWWPGQLHPRRIATPVSAIDIAPTLYALQGLETSAPTDGQALMDSQGRSVAENRPVFSELLIAHRNVIRSVRVGDWKYIQARQWLTPAQRSEVARNERKHQQQALQTPFDPWGAIQREQLFNLADDPGEQNNLKQAQPDLLEKMREIMGSYEERSNALNPELGGLAEEPLLDQKMLDDLKAIGY